MCCRQRLVPDRDTRVTESVGARSSQSNRPGISDVPRHQTRNYRVAVNLGLLATIASIEAPSMASAFGIFLMRQALKSVPKELDEAARIEGCSLLGVL